MPTYPPPVWIDLHPNGNSVQFHKQYFLQCSDPQYETLCKLDQIIVVCAFMLLCPIGPTYWMSLCLMEFEHGTHASHSWWDQSWRRLLQWNYRLEVPPQIHHQYDHAYVDGCAMTYLDRVSQSKMMTNWHIEWGKEGWNKKHTCHAMTTVLD